MEPTAKKAWPRRLLAWVCTMALIVGTSCSGILCRDFITRPAIGVGISLALVLLLFFGSFIGGAVMKHRVDSRNIRESLDYTESRRDQIQTDPAAQTRQFHRICRLTATYPVALAVSVLGLCFFCGAADIGSTTLPVVYLFLLYGLVSRLFQERNKPDFSKALPETAFPLLYQLVRESAGVSSDVTLPIFLGAPTPEQECNASVAQVEGETCLLLGPMLLSILTEDELRQVLRHEMAHVAQEDTAESQAFDRLVRYLGGADHDTLAIWADLALRAPLAWLLFEGQYYFHFSSTLKETDADASAADSGALAQQASALAKIAAHNYFAYEQEPLTNHYRTEAPNTRLVSERISLFREQLAARQDHWRQLLEQELPSKAATHPTFRQRWDALGNVPYSLEPAPENTPLAAEARAAVTESERRLEELDSAHYRTLRQENYLDHLDAVTAFEKSGVLLPPEQMRPVIYGYYALGMPAEAEALCDRVMENNDSIFATAFARYWKGTLMLYRYDKGGLAYLYQAMDANRNYIESGLNLIGKFCTMTGQEAELEEYRARFADFLQEKQDCSSGGITSKADLSPEILPEDWQERILAYILEQAKGKISQIYLVHEKASDSYTPSSFILRFTEDATEEEQEDIYDSVFRLLDDWPVDWEFCLYVYEASMQKPLARVPGACIYDTASTTP